VRARLTESARRDISHILRDTLSNFGPLQFERYTDTIEKAISMVAENPDRPSTRLRPELGEGIRSFHLHLATRRRGGASHVLYFVAETLPDGTREVVILRILHDRMEPHHHVTSAGKQATA